MRQQQRCWQSSLPALGKLTALPARQSTQQCRSLFTAARLGGCPPKARSGPTGLRLAMPPRSSLGRAPLRSFANESREDIAARQQDLKNFVGGNKAAPTKPASGEAGQVMEGGLAAWFWIFPAITVCLGTWQVYRWQEKKEMIRYRKERLLEPTVDLPPHLTDETLRDFEFRHVEVSGKFDPVREFVVRPRTRDGQNGGLLLTPFRRSDDGTIVLVNRGWIPAALMNDIVQRRAMLDRVSGDTRLFGLIRPGEKGGMFSPENKLADEQWYWFEVDKMRQALGLDYTPALLDFVAASAPAAKDSYPVPQPIVTKLRDNHLNYIITWYSLTVALVATMLLKGRGRVRR